MFYKQDCQSRRFLYSFCMDTIVWSHLIRLYVYPIYLFIFNIKSIPQITDVFLELVNYFLNETQGYNFSSKLRTKSGCIYSCLLTFRYNFTSYNKLFTRVCSYIHLTFTAKRFYISIGNLYLTKATCRICYVTISLLILALKECNLVVYM